jgi:plasmid stabilization system protein ParE
MSKKPRVIWDEEALKNLEDIAEYLIVEAKSLQAAKKVVKTIKDTVAVLPDNPEVFAIDPFIKDKSLKVRFFEKYSYRVLYRFTKSGIYVLTIRHSSRVPLEEI